MPANLELSCGHRSGKGQFSFQSQRRATPKNVQTSTQLYSFHMLARPCSKSSKLAFNSIWTENFQMEKLWGRIQCPSASNSRAVTAPNSEDRKIEHLTASEKELAEEDCLRSFRLCSEGPRGIKFPLLMWKKRGPFYTIGGNVNWCSYYGKTIWRSLKKLK